MSEISAAMQELARLEEKRHQQGLTPEEANHAEQLRAYLDQFQGEGGAGQAWGDVAPGTGWPANAEAWEQDPNAGWPQQHEGWQQDPNAQWSQHEGWQQDPNAQLPQQPGAEGWQDPNAAWGQPAAEGWQQDPNAQWPQQSAEGWQDPNAGWAQPAAGEWQDPAGQWPQEPGEEWPQQSGTEGWQEGHGPSWPQEPGAEGWEGADASPPLQTAGAEQMLSAEPEQPSSAEAAASAPQSPSSQTAESPSVPETSLPHWPGYEQRPDPSHAWLDDGADAAPSPWVTAGQPPAEVASPPLPGAKEGALDLAGEVDLPGLEAPPDWMNSPVPGATGSSEEPGAPLNLGAFDDPSAVSEASEPSMEIAPLSAPISTPVPHGDQALAKSLQAAASEDAMSADARAVASDAAGTADAMDDAMEVSDADIIEVSDDDVTLIDDEDEVDAPPAAPKPPPPPQVPAPAPRRPIRIAGGLGPTPAPAPSTVIPRGTPAPVFGLPSDVGGTLSTAPGSATSKPGGARDASAAVVADTHSFKDASSPASTMEAGAEPHSQLTSDAATTGAVEVDAAAGGEAASVASAGAPSEGSTAEPPRSSDEVPEAPAAPVIASGPSLRANASTALLPSIEAPDAAPTSAASPKQTDVAVAAPLPEPTDAGSEQPASADSADSQFAPSADVVPGSSASPDAPAREDGHGGDDREVRFGTLTGEDVDSGNVVSPATVEDAVSEAPPASAEVARSAPRDLPEADEPAVASNEATANASPATEQAAPVSSPTGTAGPADGAEPMSSGSEAEPETGDAPTSAPPGVEQLEASDVAMELESEPDSGTEGLAGAPEFGLPDAPMVAAGADASDAPAADAASRVEPSDDEVSGSQVPDTLSAPSVTSDAGAMVTEPAQQSPLPTASVEAPSALPSPPQQASDVPGDLPSSASGGGDVQAADAPPPQDGAPVWGPPSGAAPIAGGADVSPLQAFPEAATELADDDSSVPVLDLGDLTLASPIPDVEPTQQTEPPADGGELPAEMFEPLQPEASPVAVTEAEPVAEIELAEDPRVLEVIAQPTEIELKEVALGHGVFGETLELSEHELAEPEPAERTDGGQAAAPPATLDAPSVIADEGGAAGDEVELELELSDVEPEPAADAGAAPSAVDAEAADDGFEVDLSEGEVEPPTGVATPSTPPAIVTRFGAQDRAPAQGHAPVHTERPSIPLPGVGVAPTGEATANFPEAEFELDLEEPAFEPEEVEVGHSAEVEIELTEAAPEADLPEPSMEIELTEADASADGGALPVPSLEFDLSEVQPPSPSVSLPEPSMEIELVEPEVLEPPPPAAPPAPPAPAPQAPAPVAAAPSEAWVRGEHRVILHTVEGHVLRGTLRDANLLAAEIPLELQPGQPPERVPASRAKAVFFMLSSGQPQPNPEGSKIRITFHDGRQVPGYATAHASDAAGFFVVPVDNRTNTARIFVYRSSIQAITHG